MPPVLDGLDELREENLKLEKINQKLNEKQRDFDSKTTGSENILQERIYFPPNSSALSQNAQEILIKISEWLKKNKDVTIIIEGHTDEKGNNDYNIDLGDRHANSVKKFLVNLGISPSRMATISYGEERLADPTDSAKNRRVTFVIE